VSFAKYMEDNFDFWSENTQELLHLHGVSCDGFAINNLPGQADKTQSTH